MRHSITSRPSHRGRSPHHVRESHYDRHVVKVGQYQHAHDVRVDEVGESEGSYNSGSEHEYSAYDKNSHACHVDGEGDKATESLVNSHVVTSYCPYMRNPSTVTPSDDYVSSSLKRIRSSSDVDN